MQAIYYCDFCGNSNTKIVDITKGLFHTVVGKKEVIDNSISYHRCRRCSVVICKKCSGRMGAHKEKVGVFSTKRWTECPRCSSELICLT